MAKKSLKKTNYVKEINFLVSKKCSVHLKIKLSPSLLIGREKGKA